MQASRADDFGVEGNELLPVTGSAMTLQLNHGFAVSLRRLFVPGDKVPLEAIHLSLQKLGHVALTRR
jgi:hypothetical protein